jgi:hypothetical protein
LQSGNDSLLAAATTTAPLDHAWFTAASASALEPSIVEESGRSARLRLITSAPLSAAHLIAS